MLSLLANRAFRAGLAGLTIVAVAGGTAYRYADWGEPGPSLESAPIPLQPPIAPFATYTDLGTPSGGPTLGPMPEFEPVDAPRIVVELRGAVRIPEVYEMPVGSRIQDLIDQAGGIASDADLNDINIAAKLIDGSVLTIPATPLRGQVPGGIIMKSVPTAAQLNPPDYTRSGWRPTPTSQIPFPKVAPIPASTSDETNPQTINLNTASQPELETLPGIGPALAARIIAYRAQFPFQNVDDLTNVPGIGPKRLEAVLNLVAVR